MKRFSLDGQTFTDLEMATGARYVGGEWICPQTSPGETAPRMRAVACLPDERRSAVMALIEESLA